MNEAAMDVEQSGRSPRVQFSLSELLGVSFLAGLFFFAIKANASTPLFVPVLIQALLCAAGVTACLFAPAGSSRHALRTYPVLLLPGLLLIHLSLLHDLAVEGWGLLAYQLIDGSIAGIALSITTGLLLWLVIAVGLLCWMLVMALRVMRGKDPATAASLKASLHFLLPVGGPLLTTWLLLFASIAVVIALVPFLSFIAILLMLPIHWLLNLLAFTIVSSADEELHREMPNPIQRWLYTAGFGFRNQRALFVPILVGTLILGGFVLVLWSGTTAPGQHQSITNFQLHSFPLADFNTTNHWYDDWASATKTPKDAITGYFFSVITVFWSTLVMLRLCREWLRRDVAASFATSGS